MMEAPFELITIDADNVDKRGFFCYMSKRKAPGYLQKRAWLEERFGEGLKIKVLHVPGGRDTGFIEYLPGEAAWRAVYAPGYLVIHCLWVVGRGKGRGYGTQLVQSCLQDARDQGKSGVVMIASDGNWLASKKLFLYNGFEVVESAHPAFQLLVHRFDEAQLPSFPDNWDTRARFYGAGLTVVRSSQCPYNESSTREFLRYAEEKGISARIVDLRTAREVQQFAPYPYGSYGVVYNGQPLSYTWLKQSDFDKKLASLQP
jgi:GNAT superfamily N-acetyltransferase